MSHLKCFHCDWQGSKYELLIGMNGIKCPKCEKHIPQDSDGWISIENGLPEEGGFYEIKTNAYDHYFEAPFSIDGNGKGIWVIPDSSIITHWRYKAVVKENLHKKK